LVHTPAVFVRAANKGVAGYGTWKSVRKMGDGVENGKVRIENGQKATGRNAWCKAKKFAVTDTFL
jgi:hypothetical protein